MLGGTLITVVPGNWAGDRRKKRNRRVIGYRVDRLLARSLVRSLVRSFAISNTDSSVTILLTFTSMYDNR